MARKTVNIHEAKTHLSELLMQVERGEEIIIARAGQPIAKLAKFDIRRTERKLGQYAGKLKLSKDFDRLPKDTAAAFEGEDE